MQEVVPVGNKIEDLTSHIGRTFQFETSDVEVPIRINHGNSLRTGNNRRCPLLLHPANLQRLLRVNDKVQQEERAIPGDDEFKQKKNQKPSIIPSCFRNSRCMFTVFSRICCSSFLQSSENIELEIYFPKNGLIELHNFASDLSTQTGADRERCRVPGWMS